MSRASIPVQFSRRSARSRCSRYRSDNHRLSQAGWDQGIALVVVPTDAVVRSDRVLLARMLSNLIQNAVRYTHSGQVKIECQPAGDQLRIRIEDTGVGISQQDLSRIWQEFEQLHNPERDRRQGLGLGLSIVRRLATLLNHPVEVFLRPWPGIVLHRECPSRARTVREIDPAADDQGDCA